LKGGTKRSINYFSADIKDAPDALSMVKGLSVSEIRILRKIDNYFNDMEMFLEINSTCSINL